MLFKRGFYLQLTLVEEKINTQQNAAKKSIEGNFLTQKTTILKMC